MKYADKKIAVVTGGAMGIGAEAAASLAKDGHHVVICDINVDAAQRFSRQLREQGFTADARQVDVASVESV